MASSISVCVHLLVWSLTEEFTARLLPFESEKYIFAPSFSLQLIRSRARAAEVLPWLQEITQY